MEMIFASNGKQIVFDDFEDNIEEYWSEICPECREKYKDILGKRVSLGAAGTCSVKGCWKDAEYYVDFDKNEVEFSSNETMESSVSKENQEEEYKEEKIMQESTYTYITTIPEDVRTAIENEVKKISDKYEVRSVIRYKHPDDKNLYRVVAEMVGKDTYSYWDCFNAGTGSLNFGYYHISFEEAMQLMWNSNIL